MNIAEDVMDVLSSGGLDVRMKILGSTGKKKKGETSGDIDIAVETSYEDADEAIKILDEHYGPDLEINKLKAYGIVSVGVPYTSIEDKKKTAQVDLMFTHNMDFCEFMNWSPDYKNDESEFKGLYRTNLIEKCASHVDLGLIKHIIEDMIDLPEGFSVNPEKDEDGNVKSFWGLALDHSKGLKLHHYTMEGVSGKRLSHPRKLEGDSVFVTDNPDEIINLCIGSTADRDTVSTFEKLVDYLTSGESDRFRTQEELDKLFLDYQEDPRHTKDINDIVSIDHYISKGMEKW